MPSFTLWPARNDRSTIILHLLTWCDLGTSQIGLTCTYEPLASAIGPTKRTAATSLAMCVSTTAGFATADGWRSKPTWKPLQRPVQMKATNVYSGWYDRYHLSPSTWMGVEHLGHDKVDKTDLCNSNCRRSCKYLWWPTAMFIWGKELFLGMVYKEVPRTYMGGKEII